MGAIPDIIRGCSFMVVDDAFWMRCGDSCLLL